MTFSPGGFIPTRNPQTATRFLFAYSPYHFAAPQCMFSQVHFFFELFISPLLFYWVYLCSSGFPPTYVPALPVSPVLGLSTCATTAGPGIGSSIHLLVLELLSQALLPRRCTARLLTCIALLWPEWIHTRVERCLRVRNVMPGYQITDLFLEAPYSEKS